MVLAGVDALSLAATIFQVIDFSSKIVSKGKELYRSSNGVLRENQVTETVASHLQVMSRRLITTRTGSDSPSEQDAMLKKICENCIALSQELLEHLGKLQVPKTGDRKWKSFRQALKTVWSKQGVDEMARRLEDARHDLDTFVLLQIRQDLSAQMNGTTPSPLPMWDGARAPLGQSRAAWIAWDAETRKQSVEISFLDSLRFPMMPSRKERVAKAHESTFRWIFKDPEAIHKPWNSFVKWLRHDGGIYWINGKAASGKSTLMKYISYHWVTMDSLRNWSTYSGDTRSDLLTGSFFFWNSGIPEQRSQIGLLRSLLYEILNARKYLIPEVFPNEWEDKCSLVSHGKRISLEAWSLRRLECAFQTLTSVASNRKFCFFIDGLDEFEGDHRRIGTLFKDLSSNPNVKFCVSSRPWPIFQTIFNEAPQLRLQDLTLDDIKAYVEKELLETEDMQQLINEDPEDTGASILMEDIVTKAAGVFLWVVLVVRSLLAGLGNGDGVIHLRKRLDLLPADLEDLYESMLDSIEDIYHEQSSQIFQIFRAADYNLTIPVLYGTLKATFPEAMKVQRQRNMKEAYLEHKQPLSLHRSLYAQYDRVQSQLNSRTKGLLEVEYFNRPDKSKEVIIEDDDKVKFPAITYLHRTTRDYIESPKIWNRLVGYTRKTKPEPRSAHVSPNRDQEHLVYKKIMYQRTGRYYPRGCTAS
ncbi:hypothetical protein BKA61DRAFT_544125 [Leptodontidium sp. MPI-SDFR-AT-0119]|nr:hypothetical protein BKA61DRAFT_544125 [Leptodontidium sp. MPI-SDFR-AT-0119]